MGIFISLCGRNKEKIKMQIIVDFYQGNKEKEELQRANELNNLLIRLEKNNYKIHSNFGIFVFAAKQQKIIDVGRPGINVKANFAASKCILNKGKLALIDTKKKYVVFANTYFLATHFCHMKRIRPLSLHDVNSNFKKLILEENEEKLSELYLKNFEDLYGKDSEAIPLILGINEPLNDGYWVSSKMSETRRENDA